MKKLIYFSFWLSLLAFSNSSFAAANVTQSNFTGLTVPQYMGSGTATRLPVLFRATVSGLTANKYYRYYLQGATNSSANGASVDFGTTNPGAGNTFLMDASGTATYTTGPALTTIGTTCLEFQADASGNYTGWFGFVNTGNGRFTGGNIVYPCIVIGGPGSTAGTSTTTVTFRLALDLGITVLNFGSSAIASDYNGTFLKESSSSASAKNISLIYDNIFGTGRPLYATPIENTGSAIGSVITGYTTTAGGWNAIIPNANANGVRRIEQRNFSNTLVACAKDADGSWPTGPVNTVNPTGGTTALIISSSDAPLSSGCSALLDASPASVTGLFAIANSPSVTPGSFIVSGSELNGTQVSISAPAGFEVSFSSGSGYTGVIYATNGSGNYASPSLTATTIYVRIASSPTPGPVSGNVTVSGGGASVSPAVAVSGTISGAASILLSPTSLTGFSTPTTSASASQFFDITASGLSPATGSFNFSTGVSTDWELSTDGGTNFYDPSSPSLSAAYSGSGSTITYTSGSHVYVRLKNGLSAGAKSATLTVSGGSALDKTVSLDGNVLSPSLAVAPTSLSGFCAKSTTASASQQYTLTGSNLNPASGTLTIDATGTGWEVSTTGSALDFHNSINPSYTGGAISATIYTRLKTGLATPQLSKTGSIKNYGGGIILASSINESVSGDVYDPTFTGPNDLSIVGVSSNGTDGVAFANWITMPANQVLYISDRSITTGTIWPATGENLWTWTNGASSLSAGTVTVAQGSSTDNGTLTGPSALPISGISNTGDNVFIFEGSNTCPYFVYGLVLNSTWGAGISNIAAGLTNGTNAIEIPASNGNEYPSASRSTLTTFALYQGAVNTASNWVNSSSGSFTLSSTDFTVPASITINSVTPSSFTLNNCSASPTATIDYTATGTFNGGNTFTAELSDGSGNFSSPVTLGSGSSPLTVNIPAGTPTGNYKIRVNSSSPIGNGTASSAFSITQNGTGCVVAGDYQTVSGFVSGTWNSNTTWEKYNGSTWVACASGDYPDFTGATYIPNVWIRTGTVTLSTSGRKVNNLNVASVAKVFTNQSVNNLYLQMYGNVVCNGTLGNGSIDDGLGLKFENVSGVTQKINGTGTCDVSRITKDQVSGTTNVEIDMNVGLHYADNSSNGSNTQLYNDRDNGALNVTVDANRTVTFYNGGDLAIDATNGAATADKSGVFTIFGTLTGIDNLFARANQATGKVCKLDIKGGGRVSCDNLIYEPVYTGGVEPFDLTIEANGTLEVRRAAVCVSGTLSQGSGKIVLKSDASNTAALVEGGMGYTVASPSLATTCSGTYSGNITAERYVTGPTGSNQHFVGLPVSGVTLASLGANSSGGRVIPKSTCDETQADPSTPTSKVFEWQDTYPNNTTNTCPIAGWYGKVSSDAVTPGKGYSAYLNSGAILSVTGQPNISNTSNAYATTGLGNTGWDLETLQTSSNSFSYKAGWHLVSNPYPNTVTLDASHTGFDNIAIWNPSGQFSGTFSVTTISGTTLAPFQGFYVHVANGFSNQTWNIAKSERTIATGTTFHSQITDNALSIMVSGNGYNDITYVEFNDLATAQFDAGFDSRKLRSALGQPTIYTTLGNEHISFNINKSIEETPAVPLGLLPGANGTFTFNFDGINTFDPTSYVYLEDLVTGTWTDLRQNPAYNFSMGATDNEMRFVLHFTPAAQISTTDATCSSDGNINVVQSGNSSWSYTLTDASSNNISNGTLDLSTPLHVSAPYGVYTLTLTGINGYTVMKNIIVDGAQSVEQATFTAATNNVQQNDAVIFVATTSNVVSYDWDFGDGSTGAGLNQNHSYSNAGTYSVTLTVTNQFGCQSTTTQNVTVTQQVNTGIITPNSNDKVNIWSSGNRIYVAFNKAKSVSAVIDIYNVLGQQISSEKFSNSTVYTKSILNMETAYVIVRIKNADEIVTQKVLITNK